MLNFHRQNMGGLDCVVAESDDTSRQTLAMIVMHGFGATGEDLVPIAEELVDRDPSLGESVKFIFPAAPLEPAEMRDYGGRAWWPIDMAKLQRAMMLGDFRDLRADLPELLPAARQHLFDLIDDVRGATGWSLDRIVLGGFSQGSMLATDVTLRLPESPGGLVVWSGTLLCENEWKPLMPRRKGLRVVQSHGRQDQILPFAAAEWLRDALVDAGLEVEFLPFNGPHTISQPAIEATVRLLKEVSH
ncbi:Phospholipase/Carboxylesterase [Caulifigura coniformis]|uniref:Phospholipase/Carboxylesterase n=1 Tax=Caulifigura coniformis TaxID=2527983 RepID=A0A517SA12_9PLAN|nr:phospholipase [Caulifigura coniformis]QDT52964.1 Phospholipase/Carboxylesterase [Caulifigura coniformis]